MLSSLFQSPKTILAEQLTALLSVYFDVDNNGTASIESNLLHDTKIVLRNLGVKPIVIGSSSSSSGLATTTTPTTTVITGRVRYVEFTWKWGGDNTTSFIRETFLSIQGVDLHVVLAVDNNSDVVVGSSPSPSPSPATTTSSSTITNKNNKGKPTTPATATAAAAAPTGFLDTYVQQIIDHLTLKVANVKVTIEGGGGAAAAVCGSVVLEMETMELLSMGRTTTTTIMTASETSASAAPLSQRLSIGSFLAYVLLASTDDDEDNNETTQLQRYPLIDAIPYALSVTRIAGRRFVGGITRGLVMTGESFGRELAIHAGYHQVRVLSALLSPLARSTTTESSSSLSSSKEEEDGHCVNNPSPPGDGCSDDNIINNDPVSTADLPLPSMAIFLPNDCVVRLPTSRFIYALDGSVCHCSGTGTMNIDGVPIVTLTNHTTWSVQASGGSSSRNDGLKIVVENSDDDDDDDCLLAEVVLHETILQRLMKGLVELSRLSTSMVSDCSLDAATTGAAPPPPSSSSSSFAVTIRGRIQTSLVREDGTSLVVETGAGSIIPHREEPWSLAGVQVSNGQMEEGRLFVEIPAISYHPASGRVVVSDAVHAQGDSLQTLESLREFVDGFVASLTLTGVDIPSSSSSRATTEPPDSSSSSFVVGGQIIVHVPLVTATILHPQRVLMHVRDISIDASHRSMSIRSVSCARDDDGGSLELQGVHVGATTPTTTLTGRDVEIYLKVDQIAALDHDVSSSTPVPASAEVRYRNGTVHVSVSRPSLYLYQHLLSESASQDLAPVAMPSFRNVPIAVTVHDLLVSDPLPDIDKVRLVRANFEIDQDHNSAGILTTNFQCSSVQGLSCESSTGRTITVECMPCHFSLDGMGGLVLGELQGARVRCCDAGGKDVILLDVPRIKGGLCHGLTVDQTIGVMVHSVDSAADFLTHFQAICAAGSGKNNVEAPSSGQSSPFGLGSLHLVSVTATVLSPQRVVISGRDIVVNTFARQMSIRSLSSSSADSFTVELEGIQIDADADVKVEKISSFDLPGFGKSHESSSSVATAEARYRYGTVEVSISHPSLLLYESVLQPTSDVGHSAIPSFNDIRFALTIHDLLVAAPLPDIDNVRLAKAHFEIDQELLESILNTNFRCSGVEGLSCEASNGRMIVLDALPFQLRLTDKGSVVHGELQGAHVRAYDASCSDVISLDIPGIKCDFAQNTVQIEQTVGVTVHSVESATNFLFHARGGSAKNSPNQWFGNLAVENMQISIQYPDAMIATLRHLSVDTSTGASSINVSLQEALLEVANVGSVWMQSSTSVALLAFDPSMSQVRVGKFDVHLSMPDSIDLKVAAEESTLKLTGESYQLSSASCGGCTITSPLFARVDLSLPAMCYDCNLSRLDLSGAVRCSMGSLDLIMQNGEGSVLALQDFSTLLSKQFSKDSSSDFAPSLRCPEILVAIDEKLMLLVEMKYVDVASGEKIQLGSLVVSTAKQERMALRGISAQVSSPLLNLRIDSIDELSVPGVLALRKPLLGTQVEFSTVNGLSVIGGVLDVTYFPDYVASNVSSAQVGGEGTVLLPASVSCVLQQIVVCADGRDSVLDGVSFSAVNGTSTTGRSCTDIHGEITRMRNELADITHIKARCNVINKSLIEDLDVVIANAKVTAGFSSVQWSSMLATKARTSNDPLEPIWLPKAHIAPVVAQVKYKGVVVSTEALLNFPDHNGNEATTLQSLTSFYTKAASVQMPSFFSNSKVLGTSVTDMGASTAGLVVVGTAMGGAVGSIGGLVAIDGIKGAISSGKKSRGAAESDAYHFGDLSRGVVRAVKESAKSGAAARTNGESSEYKLGDFSRGAISSIAQYGDRNRERFGASGGSTVGMMVGAVALGPLGLVAGAVAGSVAGARAMRKAAPKGEGDLLGIDQGPAEASPHTMERQVDTRDLLGLGTVPAVPVTGGSPGQANAGFRPMTAAHDALNRNQADRFAGHHPLATSATASSPLAQQYVTAGGSRPNSTPSHPPRQQSATSSKLLVDPGDSEDWFTLQCAGTAAVSPHAHTHPQYQSAGRGPISHQEYRAVVSGAPQAYPLHTQTQQQQQQQQQLFAVAGPVPAYNVQGQSSSSFDPFSVPAAVPPVTTGWTGNSVTNHNSVPAAQQVAGLGGSPTEPFMGQQHQSATPLPPPLTYHAPARTVPDYQRQGDHQHQLRYYQQQQQQHHQMYQHQQQHQQQMQQQHQQQHQHQQQMQQQHQQQHQQQMQQQHQQQQEQQHQQQQQPASSGGYQFGDLTRSVIAKGKQARGVDAKSSQYQFGDFTRGLFGKK